MSDKSSDGDRMIQRQVCIFNNTLKCHPQMTYIIPTGKITDSADTSKFFDFVEKVCAKCPTYLFIKDKGIPK